MINEKIYLDENDESVVLETYAHVDPLMPRRDAILIFPGGGYVHLASFREGDCIATAYASRGVNAFVLSYRLGPKNNYPSQLLDAARAIVYIKNNAEKYGINPDRVFITGFSAGGHLCGSLATKYAIAEKLLGLPEDAARPAGAVLCYPVVSAMCPTHKGSFSALLGKPFEELTEEERRLHSHELHVDKKTPPAFIWHTATDNAVPPEGALRLALAYINAGVTVEMHLYPYGPHGIALASDLTSNGYPDFVQPRCEEWVDKSVSWMKTL